MPLFKIQWLFTGLRTKPTALLWPGRLCTICALDTFLTSFPTTSRVHSAGPAASLPTPNSSKHIPAAGLCIGYPHPLEDSFPIHSQDLLPLWGFCLYLLS